MIPRETLNLLHNGLGELKLSFSNRYNAKYNIMDAILILMQMGRYSVCAEQASSILQDTCERVAGADWLLKVLGNTCSTIEMIQRCDAMLHAVTAQAMTYFKYDKKGSLMIAIDKHLIPRYDKDADMKYLIFSKPKNGTKRFEAYMTAQIVSGYNTAGLNLACSIVTRSDFNTDLVRKMLQKCSEFSLGTPIYLLDREFYSVDVMKTIREHRCHFIMPAKKTDGIKKALYQYDDGKRNITSKYTVRSDSDSFEYTLVIVPSKNPESYDVCQKYHIFATTLYPEDLDKFTETISEQYKNRWGIETGYRVMENTRSRTTSKNPAIRILLFYYTLALYNAWIAHRRLRDDDPTRSSYVKNDMEILATMRLVAMVVNHIMTQYKYSTRAEPG